MKSSQEIAIEKNEDRIRLLNEKRMAAFERGLESLDRFDMERTETEVSQKKYLDDSHADLKKIMSQGNVVTKWGKTGKDEDAE